MINPTKAKIHVDAWNRPSQSVLVSRPATVVSGVAALAREHVMPLEDLVEQDPVHEAAEADAEEHAAGVEAAALGGEVGGHRPRGPCRGA